MKHNFPKHSESLDFIMIDKKLTKEQIRELRHLGLDQEEEEISIMSYNLPDKNSPYFGINLENMEFVSGTIDKKDSIVSFEEFKNYLQGKGKLIKPPIVKSLVLNSERTAVITKDNIKVGCNTFTHAKIAELYKLSQKVLKSK